MNNLIQLCQEEFLIVPWSHDSPRGFPQHSLPLPLRRACREAGDPRATETRKRKVGNLWVDRGWVQACIIIYDVTELDHRVSYVFLVYIYIYNKYIFCIHIYIYFNICIYKYINVYIYICVVYNVYMHICVYVTCVYIIPAKWPPLDLTLEPQGYLPALESQLPAGNHRILGKTFWPTHIEMI